MQQLIDSLRDAAWTGHGATIGASRYSRQECKAFADRLAAVPAMLDALRRALPLVLEALAERESSDDDADRENFADYQADVQAIKDAIAAAAGTPTSESAGATPTVEASAPVSDFAGHSEAITAAQGYVSDPAGWNAPTPAQVAHLLSLCGISHGPVAANGGA